MGCASSRVVDWLIRHGLCIEHTSCSYIDFSVEAARPQTGAHAWYFSDCPESMSPVSPGWLEMSPLINNLVNHDMASCRTRSRMYMVGRDTYIIDFSSMLQTNLDTGIRRKVRSFVDLLNQTHRIHPVQDADALPWVPWTCENCTTFNGGRVVENGMCPVCFEPRGSI
jgi:hypothetical protein